MTHPPTFNKVNLETGPEGLSRFREETLQLDEGKALFHLTKLMPGNGMQLRKSPAGYQTELHNTIDTTWVFVLSGALEIGLADGSSRTFRSGDHFHAQDTLPEGATFDPAIHGHTSRTVGDEPVLTVFVKG